MPQSFVLSIAVCGDLAWARGVIKLATRRGVIVTLERDFSRRNQLPQLDAVNSPRTRVAEGRGAIERHLQPG